MADHWTQTWESIKAPLVTSIRIHTSNSRLCRGSCQDQSKVGLVSPIWDPINSLGNIYIWYTVSIMLSRHNNKYCYVVTKQRCFSQFQRLNYSKILYVSELIWSPIYCVHAVYGDMPGTKVTYMLHPVLMGQSNLYVVNSQIRWYVIYCLTYVFLPSKSDAMFASFIWYQLILFLCLQARTVI